MVFLFNFVLRNKCSRSSCSSTFSSLKQVHFILFSLLLYIPSQCVTPWVNPLAFRPDSDTENNNNTNDLADSLYSELLSNSKIGSTENELSFKGKVDVDQINFLILKGIDKNEVIKFTIKARHQLKVLFRYGGLPSPSNHDAMFDLTERRYDYLRNFLDVLEEIPPSNLAVAKTDCLIVGVWGGSPLSSVIYFVGKPDYVHYDITITKQAWAPTPPPPLAVYDWSPTGPICTDLEGVGILGENLNLMPLKIDGLPEIVEVHANASVVISGQWDMPDQVLQACLSPSSSKLGSFSEVCADISDTKWIQSNISLLPEIDISNTEWIQTNTSLALNGTVEGNGTADIAPSWSFSFNAQFNLSRPHRENGWQLVLKTAHEGRWRYKQLASFQSAVCVEALYCQPNRYSLDQPIFVQKEDIANLLNTDSASKTNYDDHFLKFFGSERLDNSVLLCPAVEAEIRSIEPMSADTGFSITGGSPRLVSEQDVWSLFNLSATQPTPTSLPIYSHISHTHQDLAGGTVTIHLRSNWRGGAKGDDIQDSDFTRHKPTVALSIGIGAAPLNIDGLTDRILYHFSEAHSRSQGYSARDYTHTWELIHPRLPAGEDLYLRFDVSFEDSLLPVEIPGYTLELMPAMKFEYCSTGACPQNRGSCSRRFGFEGFIFGHCECRYQYSGLTCEDDVFSDKEMLNQVLTLILTNLPMCWGVYLTIQRGLFDFSAILVFSMFTSSIYHLCDMDYFCLFGLDRSVWQMLDVFVTYLTIMRLVCYLSYIPQKLQGLFSSFCLFLAAIVASLGPPDHHSLFIVFITSGMMFVTTFIWECIQRRRVILIKKDDVNTVSLVKLIIIDLLKDWNMVCVFLGVACLSTAGITFNIQDRRKYWIYHSVWHATSTFAVSVYICARRLVDQPHHCQYISKFYSRVTTAVTPSPFLGRKKPRLDEVVSEEECKIDSEEVYSPHKLQNGDRKNGSMKGVPY